MFQIDDWSECLDNTIKLLEIGTSLSGSLEEDDNIITEDYMNMRILCAYLHEFCYFLDIYVKMNLLIYDMKDGKDKFDLQKIVKIQREYLLCIIEYVKKFAETWQTNECRCENFLLSLKFLLLKIHEIDQEYSDRIYDI